MEMVPCDIPTYPPPLEEAITEEMYNLHLNPTTESPQEEVDEENVPTPTDNVDVSRFDIPLITLM